jgi:histidinol-phosphate aminotransferase
MKKDVFLSFLHAVPKNILIVIDEAYYEYITDLDYPNTLALLEQFHNIIITRTFSKIYGLAGLRVGYGISHPTIIELLNKMRNPFNVNSLALTAAKIALSDNAHLQLSCQLNQEGLIQLKVGFDYLNIPYLPPIANFVTIYLGQNALSVYQSLLENGIILRSLNDYGLGSYLRVTVGTAEQNTDLLEALGRILNQRKIESLQARQPMTEAYQTNPFEWLS